MCLANIVPTTVPDRGISYKVFHKNSITGDLHASSFGYTFRGLNKKDTINPKREIAISIVCDNQDQTYSPGFHSFLKLEDAKKYKSSYEVLIKCEYEGVIAQGIQEFNEAFATDGPHHYISVDAIVTKSITPLEVLEERPCVL